MTNFLAMIVAPGLVISNGFFLDSINGNDANNGQVPELPLRTMSALPAAMASGKTIWFTNNGFWREQLTIPTNNITVDTYGTGARPIIDCSDVVTNTWSKTGSYTNLYQFTLVNPNLSVVTFIDVWENNSNQLSRATDITNADATAATYWVTNDAASPSTVFIHATGNGNPASNGKTYEVSQRNFAIDAWSSGFTNIIIRGVQGRRNLNNNGSIQCNGAMYNSWAVNGTKHNSLFEPGSWIESCVFSNWYFGGAGGSPVVLFTDIGTGQITTLTNDLVTTAIYDDAASGLIAHTGSSGYFERTRVLNCTFYNLGSALAPFCRFLEVVGGSITNCYTGVTSDNFSLLMTNVFVSCTNRAVSLSGGQISSNYISGCVMTNEATPYQISVGGSAQSLLVQNCALGGTFGIYATSTNPIVTSRTNIFRGTGSAYFVQVTNQIISDYNSFPAGMTFLSSDVPGFMTFAQWKAHTGQDAHSTNP